MAVVPVAAVPAAWDPQRELLRLRVVDRERRLVRRYRDHDDAFQALPRRAGHAPLVPADGPGVAAADLARHRIDQVQPAPLIDTAMDDPTSIRNRAGRRAYEHSAQAEREKADPQMRSPCRASHLLSS
jgi:hypothetical protein